ncbi:DUF5954 family protein [Kitasatospora sp. NPDC054939]
MTQRGEDVPEFRTVGVGGSDAPVAVLADVEAWTAREAYPRILAAGGPAFGVAKERSDGAWELLPYFGESQPQCVRDGLASTFRRAAAEAGTAGDGRAAAECSAAAVRLDGEVLDELTVCGVRYRVVRAEQFIRSGPQGPEPPRPSDPDPAPLGESHLARDPRDGFVLDPARPTGRSEGVLREELLGLTPGADGVDGADRRVREDALAAVVSHPGGVLLPAAFMVAEQVGGAGGPWAPRLAGPIRTPQGARETVALGFRVIDPVRRRLDPEQRAAYAEAAERLEGERLDEILVGGRRLRIVRVEQLVRFGPDGPEGPRPSDRDDQVPFLVQQAELRAQGIDPESDDPPEEPSEEDRELSRLFEEERLRREARQEANARRRTQR